MKKLSVKSVYSILTGTDRYFSSEHRIFNLTCLFTIAGFSSLSVINIVLEINQALKLITLVVVCAAAVLYYYCRFSRFSRVKNNFQWATVLYFLMILFSLFFIGALNGGITGGIVPMYTSILALMLFVMSGVKRIFLLAIWTFSISSLFFLEYHRPEMIVLYSNIQQKYVDLSLSYFSGIIIVAIVIVNMKQLYLIEKKGRLNGEDLIEQYRSTGLESNQIFIKKINLLSRSEREICKLLIQGKSNKEIAKERFIGIGTVKSHLNKIYKKLGTKNRVEVINLMGENITFL